MRLASILAPSSLTHARPELVGALASVGLASVLVMLGAFGGWVTWTTHQVASEVRRSAALSWAWDQAQHAVTVEESLERKYRLEPGPTVLAKHRAAAQALTEALQQVQEFNDEDDMSAVAEVLANHEIYLEGLARLFAAVDDGDIALVVTIDGEQNEPIFDAIEDRVFNKAIQHASEASQHLDNLGQTEGIVYTMTPLVFALGLVFLGIFWTILRSYQYRAGQAARRELTLVQANAEAEKRQLRSSEERFRSLVSNTSDVITILDPSGSVTYHTPTAERAWGVTSDVLYGRSLLELVHPDDKAAMNTLVTQALESPEVNFTTEVRLGDAAGAWQDFEVIVTNHVANPNVAGIITTFHNVTERKSFERELTHLAFHDVLSGLPNRALFLDRLQHGLARAARTNRLVAVLFLDLDNFKVINDSLGHEAGDRLLQMIAARLQGSIRAEDTIARFGGDEFTILLEDVADPDEVLVTAERIGQAIRKPVTLDGHETFPSISVGIAVSMPGDDADSLLRNADLAMYCAKANGKARCEMFDPGMNLRAMERLDMEADLRRAIDQHEFRVVYQPILQLTTGRISGLEALVRWEHPRRGLVSPADFIPIAEETGLIIPIGQWVLEEACRQAQVWQHVFPGDPPLLMSVNLSARQFQHPELMADISRALSASGLDPHALKLEITESAIMRDTDAAVTTMWELKALGIQLAIDDFGTGYSSLSYLKRFPIDTLKIDRSFIDGLGQDTNDSAIVRSIVALARSLNLTITGEGVETNQQLSELKALGCDSGQGYYFHKPLSSDAVSALFDRTRAEQAA